MIWVYNTGHFISKNRPENTNYLVFSKEETEKLKKPFQKLLKSAKKRADKLQDIQDGGEATSRQQTALIKAYEECNMYQSFLEQL